MDWSPEQISGSLKDELGILISHERIYQNIWSDKRHGGTLAYVKFALVIIRSNLFSLG
jgi:IS30 family transposase